MFNEMLAMGSGGGDSYSEQFTLQALNETKTITLPFDAKKFFISWTYDTSQYISVDYDYNRDASNVLITIPPSTVTSQSISNLNFVQSVSGKTITVKAGASNQVGKVMTLVATSYI